MLEVKILDDKNTVLAKQTGSNVYIEYEGLLRANYAVSVRAEGVDFISVQLDESLAASIVYVPNRYFKFIIPSENVLESCFPPEAFKGNNHKIRVYEPEDAEIYGLRNLALNPYDMKGKAGAFPHAIANFVTREELASDYFLERREMGCINIGGKGVVIVDGKEYEMNPRDGIYIGKGNKDILFKSCDENLPAKFYVASSPAHTNYPTVKIDIEKARKVPCGSFEECNKRVINQYIHPDVMKSCQLSMGLTQLESGSNWNTMPCHTHDRRMEVYLYLDMGEDDIVFHMFGEPQQTRHIVMHNEEAVICPSWSIHSGVGTKSYSFIWSMCGENQEFDDMDHIENKELL